MPVSWVNEMYHPGPIYLYSTYSEVQANEMFVLSPEAQLLFELGRG